MVPFDHEMMTTSWEDFITEILVKRYHAVHLVAGHDHRFGHKNQGTPALLQAKCAELGLGCDIIPEVTVGVSLSALPISAGWWDLDRWSGPWTIWAILTS